ncbi:C69 family dipeptidase [Terrabacter terrigena]|uniref:Dipeptidase n=1 Tax=Terrabacter terrigena TaxID=574718 RepID=A0ABW3MYW1_9MICO
MSSPATLNRPWSCDTFLVAADRAAAGATLLAKNSDRPAGECQPLRFHPARTGGGTLELAYRSIPDAEATYAHLGASPYWCWGHELGLNERGVAIGNEALFTRPLAEAITRARAGTPDEPGILGMELLRLGLERGGTADEALEVMIALLEQYGQWGSGVGGRAPEGGAYDNSFMVADATGGWVLETAGRHWAARKISSGTWSISNQPTLRRHTDRMSEGLPDLAVRSGWHPKGPDFDFARAVTDPMTPLQASQPRLQRSRQLLADAGAVDERRAMGVLRDHYEGSFLDGPFFSAALPDLLTICMHEHPAGFTWGNTASSTVCVLPGADRLARMWWAAGTPCTGVYVPLWVEAQAVPAPLAAAGSHAGQVQPPEVAERDHFDPQSYWWRFLQLLEATKGGQLAWDFAARQPVVRAAFDALEQRWLAEVPAVEEEAIAARTSDPARCASILGRFTESCVAEATGVLEKLLVDFTGSLDDVDARWSTAEVAALS